MKRKVSIIVPIYNAESCLDRCINSIINQTYKNIEIILIDDGSTDQSGVLCDAFSEKDSRVCVIHKCNQGVASARNIGIEHATGEYIAFVDADDWIELSMIEELIMHMDGADIVSSGILWERFPGEVTEYKDLFDEGEYLLCDKSASAFWNRMIFDLEQDTLQPFTPWIWNKLFRRDLLLEIYKEFDATIAYAEDTLLLYKYLFRANALYIMHKPFYHYCFYENSLCHKKNTKRLEYIGKIYNLLIDDCKAKSNTSLVTQLNRWIYIMTKRAIDQLEPGEEKYRCIEFLLDTRVFDRNVTQIAIYGAGNMGQDYIYQLAKLGYSISCVVDGNWPYWRELGYDVSAPDRLITSEYDIVLVAVSNARAADQILHSLEAMGIERDKVIWQKPICV